MAWRRLALVVVISTLVTCCAEGERGAQISGEAVALSERRLEVILGCYESVRVEVDETPEEVTVQGFGEGVIDGDCASVAVIELMEPLGDRDLIDAETGRVVAVVAPDE